jgi:hypothetical protein
MFDDDADGGKWIPSILLRRSCFQHCVQGEKENLLTGCILITTRSKMRLSPMTKSELILEGEHYDYLAKLSLYEKNHSDK